MKSAAFTSVRQGGVTIIEVLASALLIFMGLGAIFAMNTESLRILYSTRMLANGSQILQERMEAMRNHPWPEVASAQALAKLFKTPTSSQSDLGNTTSITEVVTVSIPSTPGVPTPDNSSFQIRRHNGNVNIVQSADLTAQPLLLVDISVVWEEHDGTKQRELRAIIGRNGLTRSGVFGSAFGRPPITNSPETPAP
jgi:hypothetical protein